VPGVATVYGLSRMKTHKNTTKKMNNTDPTKTGFTEKYVYKADFDKKII
jgi:hypothetical protein